MEMYRCKGAVEVGSALAQLPACDHDIITAAVLECAKAKSVSVVMECRNCQLEAVIVKVASDEAHPKPKLNPPNSGLRKGTQQSEDGIYQFLNACWDASPRVAYRPLP
jgi:hypothetical protein